MIHIIFLLFPPTAHKSWGCLDDAIWGSPLVPFPAHARTPDFGRTRGFTPPQNGNPSQASPLPLPQWTLEESKPSTLGQNQGHYDQHTTDDDLVDEPSFHSHSSTIHSSLTFGRSIPGTSPERNGTNTFRENVEIPSGQSTRGSPNGPSGGVNEINGNLTADNRSNERVHEQHRGDQISGYNGPCNSVEVVSIAVIILLIISLFVYHCERASRLDSKIKKQNTAEFQRRKLRRKHSFSRSSSFASNLESVREEPGECIFDTRLADRLNRKEIDQKKRSSPFYEPWYKWLQKDSSENNDQTAPNIEKQHSSMNDLELTNTKQPPEQKAEETVQVIGHQSTKFNPPTAPQSYLITVSKHELDAAMPRSLSFDSYL